MEQRSLTDLGLTYQPSAYPGLENYMVNGKQIFGLVTDKDALRPHWDRWRFLQEWLDDESQGPIIEGERGSLFIRAYPR